MYPIFNIQLDKIKYIPVIQTGDFFFFFLSNMQNVYAVYIQTSHNI